MEESQKKRTTILTSIAKLIGADWEAYLSLIPIANRGPAVVMELHQGTMKDIFELCYYYQQQSESGKRLHARIVDFGKLESDATYLSSIITAHQKHRQDYDYMPFIKSIVERDLSSLKNDFKSKDSILNEYATNYLLFLNVNTMPPNYNELYAFFKHKTKPGKKIVQATVWRKLFCSEEVFELLKDELPFVLDTSRFTQQKVELLNGAIIYYVITRI